MNNSERFQELAMRYLDGRLSQAETRELNAGLRGDAEARAWLWEIASQAVEMGDIARTRAAMEPNVVPLPKAAWRPGAWFGWAAAAAVFILAASVFWARREAEQSIVTVSEASGEVTWSSGGRVRSGLTVGQRLAAGTVMVESETGSVELRFPDGTRLLFHGRSDAMLAANPQKRVHLKEGRLFAEVVPQPPGRPMLLRTPTADAQVLGTTFGLTAAEDGTVLNVERGRVALRRSADGKSVEVNARQTASASLDTRSQLQAFPQLAPPAEWRLNVSAPEGLRRKCEWLPADAADPARVRAVPYQANKKRVPAMIFHGVVLGGKGGDANPMVTLTAASVLRLRYRTEKPAYVEAFLSTDRLGGGFGGNFVVPISMKTAVGGAGGWMTVEVPVARNRPQFPEKGIVLDDLRVFLLIVTTLDQDAGLEIAELSIGLGGPNP